MVEPMSQFQLFMSAKGLEITCQQCSCGGFFTEEVSGLVYYSLPPKKDFRCPKCGEVRRLLESQWPNTRFILEDELENGN